jgi:hypothetical protein
MGDGTLSPDEASAVSAVIEAQRRAIVSMGDRTGTILAPT